MLEYLEYSKVIWACGIWLVVELVFWIYITALVVRMQSLSKPQPYSIEPLQLITKAMDAIDLLESYTFEMFRGAKLVDVYKENMRSFLSWTMFASRLEDLSVDDIAKIDKGYNEMCRRYGPLKEGFNKEVKHIAMTLEPIPYIHRPLFFYIAYRTFDYVTNWVYFRINGFKKCTMNEQTYWYRPGVTNSNNINKQKEHWEKSTPLVFYHGICPGWLSYAG